MLLGFNVIKGLFKINLLKKNQYIVKRSLIDYKKVNKK
jgi:hypothetical protein